MTITTSPLSNADLAAFVTELDKQIDQGKAQIRSLESQRSHAMALAAAMGGTALITATASNGSKPARRRTGEASKNGPGPVRELLKSHGVKISERGRISKEHMETYHRLLEQEQANSSTPVPVADVPATPPQDSLADRAAAAATEAASRLADAGEPVADDAGAPIDLEPVNLEPSPVTPPPAPAKPVKAARAGSARRTRTPAPAARTRTRKPAGV